MGAVEPRGSLWLFCEEYKVNLKCCFYRMNYMLLSLPEQAKRKQITPTPMTSMMMTMVSIKISPHKTKNKGCLIDLKYLQFILCILENPFCSHVEKFQTFFKVRRL